MILMMILDKGHWDWLCVWFDSIVDELNQILLDYNYILNLEVVIIIVWLLMMMMMIMMVVVNCDYNT